MNTEDKEKGWYEMMSQIQWPDATQLLHQMNEPDPPDYSYVVQPLLVDPNDFVELQEGLI